MKASTKNEYLVPVDAGYVELLGRAVYAFAYHEWQVVWLIALTRAQKGDPRAFLVEFSRETKMTSGAVAKRLAKVLADPNADFSHILKGDLDAVLQTFRKLVEKRNRLIHAHPCTGPAGDQLLQFQGTDSNAPVDVLWPKGEIESVIREIESATIKAGEAFRVKVSP